jgi:hypothetical protein
MEKMISNVTLIGVDCVDLERLKLAADISTKEISFGKVKLLSSIPSDDPRVVKIPPIKSIKEYSDFMIKELDKYIDTDFALVFQYDGFVLNASAWSEDFLKYDYIGSPWYHLGDTHVGNGGFSLRSKKLTNWLANNWKKVNVKIHPEDIFISKFARPFIEKEGMKFAPEDIAKKFSMEGTERSVVWNGEFGFHEISYTDISKWLVNHPEYKDKLTYEINDFAILMKKYPIYDGTVHTFYFRKHNIKNYIQIAENKKMYELRLTKDKYYDLSKAKVGHTIVFRRWLVGFKDVPVPAFDRKIKKIERFDSLANVRRAYPRIHITYPDFPRWKRKIPFMLLLDNLIYPPKESYSLFWFD